MAAGSCCERLRPPRRAVSGQRAEGGADGGKAPIKTNEWCETCGKRMVGKRTVEKQMGRIQSAGLPFNL